MSAKAKRERNQKYSRCPQLKPKNKKQQALMDAIHNHEMVITTGFAGTGKTYVPTIMAGQLYDLGYQGGGIDKIILTRPNVPSGTSLGYRPGDLYEKLAEWFSEQLHLLEATLSAGAVETGLRNGNIELVPFETMRGRSFRHAMVLLDEAQNTTRAQMKMATTRIGEGCIYVVNGDVGQSDLKSTSGLATLVDLVQTQGLDVPIIDFSDPDDIVRGDLCRQMIIAWDAYEIERR
jgi:phosphate starvation-inducible PhoH-like protein